ncbi:Lon protease family protein [Thermosediminibacter litoriperuensis]|uniref:endopeptidase La n=1 Tax=Thermosediminibacter litoriperuensis TaxID=291989 RepID=A0A5S5AQ69_9FIRM|nr:ATP-binding protein [Thermosediminibacter litoriperuensis]TYP52493.1 lon-related putative ATP-dependent protease [Thermosediminibacter litoriperuensis]
MLRKLTAGELCATCDPAVFNFRSTKEIEPLSDIIGQERAIRSMEFGLRINRKGYNIFVTGPKGTGRTTYTRAAVSRVAAEKPVPDDILYVYNFAKPEKPLAIFLPAGRGSEFARDMEKLIEEIRREISRVFDDEKFENQRQELVEKYQKMSVELFEKLEQSAKADGFTVQRTPQGFITIPLKDGRPMNQEEYDALTGEERKELEEKSRALQSRIDETLRKMRALDRKIREELSELERKTALTAVDPYFEEITSKYAGFENIIAYVKAVKEDIIKNLAVIRADAREKGEAQENSTGTGQAVPREDFFIRYKVNLFVDNRATKGAPVIFETNPTYYNLFGKIEGRAFFGTVVTDFTMIKSGAVHRARGGYLVLQAEDLFKDPFAWDTLKRTLKNGEARVENIGEQYRAVPTVTLKPEPIPLDVKVIIIGSPFIYYILNDYDEDFRKLFKVKVDFDIEMERNPVNMKHYASFISHICREENLLPFESSAVARVIDYSSRLAEDRKKLSTRFNEIAEIIYEAGAWAAMEGAESVEAKHVDKAVEEKVYRSNMIEEKLFSMIRRGEIIISTEGQAVGQVNGLSVIDIGDYVFGQPSRITARTFLGDAGVINIEREAKLSGKIHDKAVMILAGYLGEKYAREMPLSVSASITFEQNYGGVEGDSATCAELLALLSSISGIPVRQDFAVTGSLDQHGNVQPVGGVTYKVEGFYHTCKIKGLTGTQGVVIPARNLDNLMLKREVIDAVKEGRFHIYAAETIDDVIEIMTGLKPEQFHMKVMESLKEMAERAKEFFDGENKKQE